MKAESTWITNVFLQIYSCPALKTLAVSVRTTSLVLQVLENLCNAAALSGIFYYSSVLGLQLHLPASLPIAASMSGHSETLHSKPL